MNHRLAIRILLVVLAAVSASTAAQPEIKGNTNASAFWYNGVNQGLDWQRLVFTPGSFDVTTTDGSATIANLGQFSLTPPSSGNDNYDNGSFNLVLTFTLPTGLTNGDTTWDAVLSGKIVHNGNDSVDLSFNQWSDTFTYTNEDGSGQFTLTLGGWDSNGVPQVVNGHYVYDLCQAQMAGQITNASFTSVPEPSAVLLFGTMLLGVTGLLRRKTG
jgi:hypothetical protein